MSNTYDELEQLREDDEDYEQNEETQEQTTYAQSSVLGKTTTVATYPTNSFVFYALNITQVMGAETEGATPVYTTGTDIFYALNIGTRVPPVGTIVLCTYVPCRWVFSYDESTG